MWSSISSFPSQDRLADGEEMFLGSRRGDVSGRDEQCVFWFSAEMRSCVFFGSKCCLLAVGSWLVVVFCSVND